MMPLLLTIGQSCERLHMAFLEHVVWVKRNATPGGNADKLKRGHESILVYGVHGRHPFYTTRGPFEDVKIPGILFDVMTIDTLQRHYSDLRLAARRGVGSIRKGRGEMSAAYTRFRTDANLPAIASGRDVNYTNVWSFLPPSLAQRNRDRLHPTQKPIEIMKRLAEMTTPAGGVVLDPFMGSGTTGVACVQTGRNFVGCELDAGFFAIAEQRIEGAAAHLGLFPGAGE
jgi:DNA modification methylase